MFRHQRSKFVACAVRFHNWSESSKSFETETFLGCDGHPIVGGLGVNLSGCDCDLGVNLSGCERCPIIGFDKSCTLL